MVQIVNVGTFTFFQMLHSKYLQRKVVNVEYIWRIYSGLPLKLCMTFVLLIMTSKHFWLLQCIWHQTRVTYPWCTTTCSYWNHCIWSQELWEHKFLVFKNGLLFYRFMVEWVSFLHLKHYHTFHCHFVRKRHSLNPRSIE